VSLSLVQIFIITLSCISLMRIMYFVKILCFCKAHYMTFLGTLSYVFSMSMKTICKSFFCPLHLSISCIKHSFFLTVFCTFSFHHHVSLPSHLPPLVTPSSFNATFLIQVTIFTHVPFTSPLSCQGFSLRTPFLKFLIASYLSFHHLAASYLSFHYFVLSALTCLLH
jgi:hypothetical protein